MASRDFSSSTVQYNWFEVSGDAVHVPAMTSDAVPVPIHSYDHTPARVVGTSCW